MAQSQYANKLEDMIKITLYPTLTALLAVGFLMTHPLYATSSSKELIDPALRQLVGLDRVRTAVLATYDNGEVEFVQYGNLENSQNQQPDDQTTFEIGSVTKVFTALLIQTLVDEDKLSWDDTLEEAMPHVNFESEATQSIPLRELAMHKSGLPSLPPSFTPSNWLDPYSDFDIEKLIHTLETEDLVNPTKPYAYSNMGFALLGYIGSIAAGTDGDYGRALQDRVLSPLNLTSSSTTGESSKNAASGFSRGATMPAWNLDAFAGAGAIHSNAVDMVSFIKHNIEGGDSTIHQSLENLRQAQSMPGQGLAWQVDKTEKGNPVYWHNGQTGGFASFLAVVPEESRGWAVLTASVESALITQMGRFPFDPTAQSKKPDLEPFTGVYELRPGLYIEFANLIGELYAQATAQPEFLFSHVEGREFRSDPAIGFVAEFSEPVEGKSQSMDWSQQGVSATAARVSEDLGVEDRTEVQMEDDQLLEYVGRYGTQGELVISILNANGQLYGRTSIEAINQEDLPHPIFPKGNDRFFYRIVDAELQFGRDEDGNIESMTLIQGIERPMPRLED